MSDGKATQYSKTLEFLQAKILRAMSASDGASVTLYTQRLAAIRDGGEPD